MVRRSSRTRSRTSADLTGGLPSEAIRSTSGRVLLQLVAPIRCSRRVHRSCEEPLVVRGVTHRTMSGIGKCPSDAGDRAEPLTQERTALSCSGYCRCYADVSPFVG